MTETRIYTDAELRYAATSRCPCGAGLAYPAFTEDIHGSWDCSDILTGRAVPSGQEGAVEHTDRLPFAFYEIKSDDQPSANGRTTRRAPLTEQESLQRATIEAHHRCESLDRSLAKAREEVTRNDRREACKALRKHQNTKWITCAVHGARGQIADVYYGNIAVWDDANGWVCDETHPGCFDWFER